MSKDSPEEGTKDEVQTGSSYEAYKAGAPVRAENSRKELLGLVLFGVGGLGFIATVLLTAEIVRGEASPYAWDAFDTPAGVGVNALKVGAYLLSYAFIGGLAFTTIWNLSKERMNFWLGLLSSLWFLGTALLFALPVIESVKAFVHYLPSGLGGKLAIVIWGIAAYFVYQVLGLFITLKKST